MKLTQSHIDFWLSKRLPKWAAGLKQRPLPSIHDLIDGHTGKRRPTDGELQTSNTLNIVRSVMKREPIREYLVKLATEPGTVITPEKRASLARKWLRRLGVVVPPALCELEARRRQWGINRPRG